MKLLKILFLILGTLFSNSALQASFGFKGGFGFKVPETRFETTTGEEISSRVLFKGKIYTRPKPAKRAKKKGFFTICSL